MFSVVKRLTIALILIAFASSAALCAAAQPAVSAPTPHYRLAGSGDGASYEIDCYTVSSAAQLRGLASLLSPEGPVYITADIWLNPDDNPTKTQFVPIGGENRAFVGTIDGMGHTIIHNLYINQPDRDSTGLIGCMTGSILNLTVTGTVAGHTYVADVVSCEDCFVRNSCNYVDMSAIYSAGDVVGSPHIDSDHQNIEKITAYGITVDTLTSYNESAYNTAHTKEG